MRHLSSCARARFISSIGFMALWLSGCSVLVTSPPTMQATASTAVVKSYPTPSSSKSLYSNALTAAAAGWASGPECVFTSNGLAVRPNGGQATICLAPTAKLSNISITVTAHQTNGSLTHAFGIAFRHAAPKSYYFFGIDGRGRFLLTEVVNDVNHIVIPFTLNAAIHAGTNATNRLQVIAKGLVITLLVNGAPIGQAILSAFPDGAVGLRGINDGEVLFQQLSIVQV